MRFAPVLCGNTAHRLRGPPIVVIQDTSESLSAIDGIVHIGLVDRLLDQLIVESLVIALKVIVVRVLLHRIAKMAFTQRNDLGQTFGFDRPNEPLCVRIQIRASRRELYCLHTGGLEKLLERFCK